MVEKTEALTNLIMNIEFIKRQNGLTNDADFCREAEISKTTMSNIRNSGRMPALYPFFEKVCRYSHYTVDELVNTVLEEKDGTEMSDAELQQDQELRKYIGVYTAYYYATSSMKGREYKGDGEALKYAVLLIYREEGGELRCIADFGLTREQQAERYEACFVREAGRRKVRRLRFKQEFVNRFVEDRLYSGTFMIKDRSIVMQLETAQDTVTLMLKRYIGTSMVYHGGLAAAVSFSKGVESVPVLQVIGIARGMISDPAEVIAGKLFLSYPSIKCTEEDERELMDMIQSLNTRGEKEGDGGGSLFITKEQGLIYLHDALTRAVNRTVQRNIARNFRISNLDNNDWYHYAKHFEEE